MLDQLQQVSMRSYKIHPVSYYLHKLNQDVKTVAVTSALHIPKIVQTIFMAVVLSIILLSVSPVLFFLLLLQARVISLSVKNGENGNKHRKRSAREKV